MLDEQHNLDRICPPLTSFKSGIELVTGKWASQVDESAAACSDPGVLVLLNSITLMVELEAACLKVALSIVVMADFILSSFSPIDTFINLGNKQTYQE